MLLAQDAAAPMGHPSVLDGIGRGKVESARSKAHAQGDKSGVLLQLVEQHRMQKRIQTKRGAAEASSAGAQWHQEGQEADPEGPQTDRQLDPGPPSQSSRQAQSVSSASMQEAEDQPARLPTDAPRPARPLANDLLDRPPPEELGDRLFSFGGSRLTPREHPAQPGTQQPTQEGLRGSSSARQRPPQNSQQATALSSSYSTGQGDFTRWEDGVRYMMAGDHGKFKAVHIRSSVDETVTVAQAEGTVKLMNFEGELQLKVGTATEKQRQYYYNLSDLMGLTYTQKKPTTLLLSFRQKQRKKLIPRTPALPQPGSNSAETSTTTVGPNLTPIELEAYTVSQLTSWFEAIRVSTLNKYNPDDATILSLNTFYLRLSKKNVLT